MKCFDCIEKGVHPPNDAEVYMIQEYESVRPLCGECLDAYIEMGKTSSLKDRENLTSYKTKKCPLCGANMEVTEYDDGTILIRRDCICDLSEHIMTDVVKFSQLGFEVPEDEAEV